MNLSLIIYYFSNWKAFKAYGFFSSVKREADNEIFLVFRRVKDS